MTTDKVREGLLPTDSSHCVSMTRSCRYTDVSRSKCSKVLNEIRAVFLQSRPERGNMTGFGLGEEICR